MANHLNFDMDNRFLPNEVGRLPPYLEALDSSEGEAIQPRDAFRVYPELVNFQCFKSPELCSIMFEQH